jgi:RNase P subunit RPR2
LLGDLFIPPYLPDAVLHSKPQNTPLRIRMMSGQVTVSCRHCGYSREYAGWYLAKLMPELGEGSSVHRLAERSKCSRCGVKRMRFTIELRDKPPECEPPAAAS